jgi:hypothetical protein
MGHQTFAGRITEQTIGGASLVRIDVPATDDRPAFTKMFGVSSIYCLTPTTEETARMKAGALRKSPIDTFDIRDQIPELRQSRLDYCDDETPWDPDDMEVE